MATRSGPSFGSSFAVSTASAKKGTLRRCEMPLSQLLLRARGERLGNLTCSGLRSHCVFVHSTVELSVRHGNRRPQGRVFLPGKEQRELRGCAAAQQSSLTPLRAAGRRRALYPPRVAAGPRARRGEESSEPLGAAEPLQPRKHIQRAVGRRKQLGKGLQERRGLLW